METRRLVAAAKDKAHWHLQAHDPPEYVTTVQERPVEAWQARKL